MSEQLNYLLNNRSDIHYIQRKTVQANFCRLSFLYSLGYHYNTHRGDRRGAGALEHLRVVGGRAVVGRELRRRHPDAFLGAAHAKANLEQ